MSAEEPKGPYVLQTHSSILETPWSKHDRLWTVGGVGVWGVTVIDGLTQAEAEAIVAALKNIP